MVTRLVLEDFSDCFEHGSTNDSRLLHSDQSDRIYVCPAHLGQGYIQEIILGDDISLIIQNYRLNRDLIIDTPSHDSSLQFSFSLADSDAKYSFLEVCLGLREIHIMRSHQLIFDLQIVFTQSTLMTYLKEFMARLLPQTLHIAEQVTRSIYRYQTGYSTSNTKEMLDRIFLQDAIDADSNATLEQILDRTVFSEMEELNNAGLNLISAAMEQAIGQILSCPYQGATRRADLKQKALQLVALYFEEAMLRSRLNQSDLDYIYQAGKILRSQSINPPTIEMLAKQVGTNRFKLNQGFHQLYRKTPFDYLRQYRMRRAWSLLMSSELPVEEVAAAVGYQCRSNFARAFRQQFGINPKVLQMQVRQGVS